MRKMNRKAAEGVMLTFIIGLVVFIFLFLITFSAISKALKSHKASDESTNALIAAMHEVANKSGNIKMKLVSVTLDEGTAIYVFNKNAEEVIEIFPSGYKRYVPRPVDCPPVGNTCICLCTEYSPGFSNTTYKNTGTLATTLNCEKKIECTNISDVDFQENTFLEKIMDSTNYEALKKRAGVDETKDSELHLGDNSYVYRWQGGMSFWRYYKNPTAAQEIGYTGYKYMFVTSYADVYVVKNPDNTIKLCFTDECLKNY